MKNFVESGDVLDVTLTASAEPGDIVVVGGLVGVLVNGGSAGETVAANRKGVYWYPKATVAVSQGDKLYLKASDNNLTKTASGNTLVGYAWTDATAEDSATRFVLAP